MLHRGVMPRENAFICFHNNKINTLPDRTLTVQEKERPIPYLMEFGLEQLVYIARWIQFKMYNMGIRDPQFLTLCVRHKDRREGYSELKSINTLAEKEYDSKTDTLKIFHIKRYIDLPFDVDMYNAYLRKVGREKDVISSLPDADVGVLHIDGN